MARTIGVQLLFVQMAGCKSEVGEKPIAGFRLAA